MRRNYFVKLIKYIKTVYNIENEVNKLTDKRISPSYKTGLVALPVLIGFLLRIKSFNELNCILKENEFKNLFLKGAKLPQIDVVRDTLKVIDLNGLANINKGIIKKAIENKAFRKGTIDGYTVAAIDGTKIFGSNKKCCQKCLTALIKGNSHYYHSGAIMSLVGETPNLVLDFEMYNSKTDFCRKDEGELNAAKRLISRVMKEHKNLVDIVTYDALACNSKFINHCIDLGLDAVIRVKQNNNNSIKQIKRKVNKKEAAEIWENINEKIEVYEELFYMSGVDKNLRYVKYAKQKSTKERSQIMIITTCLNISLKSLYKMIKARWDIENKVFNNLKSEAGLNHCFVHGGNAVEAILHFIFIASNLLQLFKQRRLKDYVPIQKELVRLIIKGLYLLKYDNNLVFSSG